MNSETNNTMGATQPQSQTQLPVASPDAPDTWRGMTLDELRRARGKALVRREVGRAAMQYSIDGLKSNVESNGVRALMFNSNALGHLKTLDYVLIGFRVARWLISARNNRRRRR